MRLRTIVLLLALAVSATGAAQDPTLTGEAAELFLKKAKVKELRHFPTKGVTEPRRAVLSRDGVTARANFKIVDEEQIRARLADGRVVQNFKDDFRHEIAAYELSKLLGSDLVPPCVQRNIYGETGSLCLWVENAMTEWDRRQKGINPPDLAEWRNQMATVELFLQLTDDIDFQNVANILVDKNWKVHKIDASRAFYTDHELPRPERLTRFSRSMLEALEGLSQEEVKASLKRLVNKYQIEALMARRDAILELAKERIAEKGEDAVLFP
jgi:hypothetical protein